MRKLLPLSMLLLSGVVGAQSLVGVPVTKPTAIARDTAMPAGKIFIDSKSFLQPHAGYKVPRVRVSCTGAQPSPCGSSVAPIYNPEGGGFRIDCRASHMSFDDPIVWPGQPGRTHLHLFFGATQTNALTDVNNMQNLNSSTCAGGSLNNSGYWVPAIVRHKTGDGRDGEVYVPYSNIAYYKAEGLVLGAPATPTMVWPPAGHRMIAGDPNNTDPANLAGNGRFDCVDGGGNSHSYNHIPTTAEVTALGVGGCQSFIHIIFFPECWDGVSKGVLGKGHMVYSDFYRGCLDIPAFPVLFPTISFNIFYTAPPAAEFDYMYLSCDNPAQPANAHGACSHGDWLNGWKQNLTSGWLPGLTGKSVTDVILDNCNHSSNNCEVDLLGAPVPGQPNTFYRLY